MGLPCFLLASGILPTLAPSPSLQVFVSPNANISALRARTEAWSKSLPPAAGELTQVRPCAGRRAPPGARRARREVRPHPLSNMTPSPTSSTPLPITQDPDDPNITHVLVGLDGVGGLPPQLRPAPAAAPAAPATSTGSFSSTSTAGSLQPAVAAAAATAAVAAQAGTAPVPAAAPAAPPAAGAGKRKRERELFYVHFEWLPESLKHHRQLDPARFPPKVPAAGGGEGAAGEAAAGGAPPRWKRWLGERWRPECEGMHLIELMLQVGAGLGRAGQGEQLRCMGACYRPGCNSRLGQQLQRQRCFGTCQE